MCIDETSCSVCKELCFNPFDLFLISSTMNSSAFDNITIMIVNIPTLTDLTKYLKLDCNVECCQSALNVMTFFFFNSNLIRCHGSLFFTDYNVKKMYRAEYC